MFVVEGVLSGFDGTLVQNEEKGERCLKDVDGCLKSGKCKPEVNGMVFCKTATT